MGDLAISTALSLDGGLLEILHSGGAALTGVVRRAVRSGVLLIAVVLVCGAAASFFEWSGTGMNTAMIVGALGVTAVSIGDIHALAGLGSETITNLDVFSKSLLPVLAAAAAAGGNVTGGAARPVATMFFSDVFLTVISRLLLPLVYAYAAACCFAATGTRGEKVSSFLKWISSDAEHPEGGICRVPDAQRRSRAGGRDADEGGQVHHLRHGSRGGRNFVGRDGGDSGGRGYPEKRGGNLRAADGSFHLRGALPAVGDPLSCV
jgi:hypothetical protein